jgi:hypothetical protein
MKVHILMAISLILMLAVSCSKNDAQPAYKSLVGNWKMVTNNGVDLKFEIISDPNNSSTLFMAFPYVSYNGQTSITGNQAVSFPLTLSNGLYNVNFAYVMGTWANGASLTNVQENSTLTMLTANSGWVSLAGFNTTLPQPWVVNLTSPIIINRVK